MIVPIAVFAWMVAVFLTDKYVHKYPQRYATYLVASHMKAAILMAALLWIMGWIAGPLAVPRDVLWSGFIFFVIADALVSVPRRRDVPAMRSSEVTPPPGTENNPDDRSGDSGPANTDSSSTDAHPLVGQIRSSLDKPLVEFMEKHLPDLQGGTGDVLVLGEVATADDTPKSAPVRLLVSRVRMNDVRRLNRFFLFCVQRIHDGRLLRRPLHAAGK